MVGVLFVLICWVVWFLPATIVNVLVFDHVAIGSGEYWRLWTGHVTHFSWQQLLIDSSVVAVLGVVVQRYFHAWQMLVLFIVAPPLLSLLFFFLVPEMHDYRGSSGIGALLWVLAGCLVFIESRRGSLYFWLSIAFLSLLIVKLFAEVYFNIQAIAMMPGDVQLSWQAHVFGVLIGFGVFLGWLYGDGYARWMKSSM